ncbi:MAG: hypothetical protein LKCHEGNO_01222 [Burkholderiaceae bacterium]|nr:hypothetical protein [Burkholderiaceae bacterium]
MNGCFLRFYVHENQRVHHLLLWQWLLQQANKLGIRGGSAFRAMAGFGRHVCCTKIISSSWQAR